MVERLNRNAGRYCGELIDVPQVLRDIEQAASAKNWVRDKYKDLLAYRRTPARPARNNIYLSTGIHGDEPAGPLAALQLFHDDHWPADAAIWFCPCLNPSGLALGTRENDKGIDLNRDYRDPQTEAIQTHVEWLKQQPQFNLSICLHEDWESHGFYVYESNPNNLPSFGEKIIGAVAAVCPIEQATLIDDWEAVGGIIRPKIKPIERPKWAEALYLMMNNSRLGYTMEAPSDFPMAVRVAALVTAVRTVLALL
jgi:hypothetical protein